MGISVLRTFVLQAENLVLTLRDLFQVVFEMKKREMDEAKRRRESTEKQPQSPATPVTSPTPSDQTADNLANVRSLFLRPPTSAFFPHSLNGLVKLSNVFFLFLYRFHDLSSMIWKGNLWKT